MIISFLRLSVVLLLVAAGLSAARADEQRIIATVNDRPITTRDIDQQIKIRSILRGSAEGISRKQALNDVIDDVVKIEEAKRSRMEVTEREIDSRVDDVAKGMKTDRTSLEAKLTKQGIGNRAFRQYLAGQIAFARLLRYKYKESIKVDKTDVDREFNAIKNDIDRQLAKIKKDPRMKPVDVYTIQEVLFPVENSNDPSASALLQSRAVEANQFMSRFKGCKSIRSAAAGIFNTRVNKSIEADASKLPKQLRQLLDSRGPGQVFGPMRAPAGIQVVAFCGKRRITPKMPEARYPTRDQIEQAAINKKFDRVEAKYLAQMRKNAVIEYKDPAYSQ